MAGTADRVNQANAKLASRGTGNNNSSKGAGNNNSSRGTGNNNSARGAGSNNPSGNNPSGNSTSSGNGGYLGGTGNPTGNVAIGGNVPSINGQDVGLGDPRSQSQRVRNVYNTADQDADLSYWNERLGKYTSRFIDNPKDWYRLYNYWDWNLAKNNPDGNLNGKKFTDTRNLSRLADALNNQRHLKLGNLGARTNSSFGSTQMQLPGTERWEPIETQEMRQMRANEDIDKQIRERQFNRAENIKDYPFNLQQMQDKSNVDYMNNLARDIQEIEKEIQSTDTNTAYGQRNATHWQQRVMEMQTDLEIYARNYATSVLKSLPPEIRQYVANVWGGMSISADQQWNADAFAAGLRDLGLDSNNTNQLANFTIGMRDSIYMRNGAIAAANKYRSVP